MKYVYRSLYRMVISLILGLISLGLTSCAHKPPRTPRHLVRYGIELAEAGYWKEAQKQWEMVLRKDPENVAALNNLAVISELTSDFAAAQELLEKAIGLRPDDTRIKHNLNALHQRINDQNNQEKKDENSNKR